jgi:demethylmenaquinone methyltransferase/2-methoxy-6-polyprenyl-1,4-benzoquinol methylase
MTSYRPPPPEAKAAYVQRQFDRIARRYDLLNDLISLGLHRGWKRATVRAAGVRAGGRYLDLCTGTGDVALRTARAAGAGGLVVGLDYTPGMLAIARDRAARCRTGGPGRGAAAGRAPMTWVRGDALRLPFADASFDGVMVSFGLRNVADLPQALREAHRVLRRGARIAIVDTGVPPNRLYRLFADAFFVRIVPWIGALVARDREAYTYLPASRKTFPSQGRLVRLMADVGFVDCGYRDLALGSAALHWGRKA